MTSARKRFEELVERVDQLFTRVWDCHQETMQCAAGCSDCCQRFSITSIEAAAVVALVRQLPAERRGELSSRARHGPSGVCAALGADGQCQIYAARPLVCRSHGAPIRADGVLTACSLNFDGGRSLAQVPPEHVFDQQTLSVVLGALDAAYAAESGAERGRRIELAELLSDLDRHAETLLGSG